MTLMILASLGLLLGLILIVLGVRGRVAQHGVFCRKCRFDLAGIDRQGSEPKCPECGCVVADQRATRPVLRRKRPVVLVLGLVLLLTGASLMGVVASNNTARVLAVMPDRVVLALHALGMDEAYTEIATNRLTRVPPLSDNTWAKLIETALEHQANANIVWDPRDGEVLMRAFMLGLLSPEQTEQYFDLGIEPFAEFPDEIRHGVDEMGLTLAVQPTGRITSLSGTMGSLTDGTDTVWNRIGITACGIVDPAYEVQLTNYAGYTGLDIPGPYGPGQGSIGGKLSFEDLDWDTIQPGQSYTFYIKYKTGVVRMSDGHIHQEQVGTLEGSVRILPSDAQLIELDTQPETIAAFQDHPTFRISPLHIFPPEGRTENDRGTHLAECGTIVENLPIAIAGHAVLIFQGQEYPMGPVLNAAMSGHGLSGIRWVEKDPVPEGLIESLLEAGSVTIEIRPDPSIAEKMPGVKRILGLPLRFEDVLVTDEPMPTSQTSEPHPDQRVGRIVTDPADD